VIFDPETAEIRLLIVTHSSAVITLQPSFATCLVTLNTQMETGMNTLQNRHKTCNFTLTVSLIAAMAPGVRDDTTTTLHRYWLIDDDSRQLPSLRSIEQIIQNFRRKSSYVCLFNFCYVFLDEHRRQKIFQIPAGFDQHFIFNTQHILIFHCIALLLARLHIV